MGAQVTEKRDPAHMPGGATVRPESGSVCLSWDTGSGGGQLLGDPGRFFFLRWDCVCLRVLSPPLCARDSASSLSWQALLPLPYKPGCVTTQSPRPSASWESRLTFSGNGGVGGRPSCSSGPHPTGGPHLMDGRCLMTTSRAWIVSKGTLGSRPESASCNACKLTQDTHLMDTLKMRSFPSPGSVTSSSTWEGTRAHGYSRILRKPVGSFHGPRRHLPVAKPAKHSFRTSFPTQPRSAPLQGGEGDTELRPLGGDGSACGRVCTPPGASRLPEHPRSGRLSRSSTQWNRDGRAAPSDPEVPASQA